MKQTKEHTEAKKAVENLRYQNLINEKMKQYIQFLGINPTNLDLDQVAEDIRKVNGN
jgi:hypothetical protein